MTSAMKKLNEDFTDKEIEMLIAEVDLNDDGKVNFKEFQSIMNKIWEISSKFFPYIILL